MAAEEMEVTIRDAIAADVPELERLDPLAAAGDTARSAAIRRWVNNGSTRVAQAQGRVAGYCVTEHTFFSEAWPWSSRVSLARLIASPRWRALAADDPAQQQHFTAHIGQLLGRPGYQPTDLGDAITHWKKYDSWQPPSQPHTTFPQTIPVRPPSRRQSAESGTTRAQHPVVHALPSRRPRHLAPRPHPPRPHLRLVKPDGRHHRHHLGQPDNHAHRPGTRASPAASHQHGGWAGAVCA